MKRILFTIALAAIIGCGGGGSGGGGESPSPAPIIPPVIVQCPGCPTPTPGLTMWGQGDVNSWQAIITQQPCDGFADYAVTIYFRQDNGSGTWIRTAAWPMPFPGGCYDNKLAIFWDSQQPCAGELWCSDPTAYVEFEAVGADTLRAYAKPGACNPDYPC